MPTMPSGLKLALYTGHIMEPDRNWFRAPENHFWYWAPVKENPDPYNPESSFELYPTTAPVPHSHKQAEQHIRVMLQPIKAKLYWRGEMLSEFPKFGSLSKEDMLAWLEWLNTEQVASFINEFIMQCKTQATINQEACGWAVLTDIEDAADGKVHGNKVVDNPLKNTH